MGKELGKLVYNGRPLECSAGKLEIGSRISKQGEDRPIDVFKGCAKYLIQAPERMYHHILDGVRAVSNIPNYVRRTLKRSA